MEAVSADGEGVTGQADRQVFTFRLGAERYGVSIDHVAEVVEPDAVTPIPDTGPSVVGVMDLRGQMTTVVDPKRVLSVGSDGDQKAGTARIVVLDTGDSEHLDSVSRVVDTVEGVVGIENTDVEAPPEGGADIVEGVHRENGEFTVLVDPERVARRSTN